jgi:cytochrome c553
MPKFFAEVYRVIVLFCLVATSGAAQEQTDLPASKMDPVSSLPVQISPVLSTGSSSMLIEKGERVAALLGCFGCHGRDLQGKAWEDDPEFAVLYTANLTRAVANYSDQQLAYAIREGMRYDNSPLWEMPSNAFLHLSEPDMQALIAFLRSVPASGVDHPRMAIGPTGREEIQAGLFLPVTEKVKKTRDIRPIEAGPLNEQGRYLAEVLCSECHGADLSGNADANTFRPDLVIAAAYSSSDFAQLMKTGKSLGDRNLGLMTQVAQSRFSHLTETEVESIHAYLLKRANLPRNTEP